MLSVLFVVIISVLSTVMYKAAVGEVYEKFINVGDKLRDVAQADLTEIEKIAPMMAAGQELPSEAMSKMKKVLSGTTDDYLVANAYYLLPTFRTEGGKNYFRYLQGSESLESMGMDAGVEYENQGSFSEVYAQALEGKSGLTEAFEDEFSTWLTYLSPLTNDNGEIIAVYGIDYDYGIVKKRLTALIWKAVVISVAAIAIIILSIWFLLKRALKPLQIMAEKAKLAAVGDLTVSVPIVDENEIGQASLAFNTMIDNLRQLAVQINQTSSEVANSSSHLKETANQTKAATHEITHSISQVATSSETQLISSGESQRAMAEMAVGIQRIAESTTIVSDLASETTNLASDGVDAIHLTVKQMGMIEERVNAATYEMQALNDSSSRISNILSHIANIANQTNLLALNASIEAARAGEHGKGFAVVAQEIRELAERSKASSEEVYTILSEISTRSESVTASLNASAQEAQMGTQLVNKSGESFQTILKSVQEVSSQVQEVSAAAEQMSAGSEEIAASLEELERNSQITASNSQQVAAASEEQLASMEEVAGASQQLNTLATDLSSAVARFKI